MAARIDEFSVKRIYPKLGGERGSRNPYGPTSSHDLVEQTEFLYVEVVEANDYSATSPVGFPIVEITLGNYKSSTETLPIRPKCEWYQVFAFDKSKGDVLSVALKDGNTNPKTLIGKRNFKLSADIPTRVPPDARLAPQWYSMKNTETGHHMDLLMSVWFGTQADEVFSQAWFSDAYDGSASCVVNTRPKLYIAPKLSYVRITIVSGHDLISNDGRRAPSVYVRATLGQHAVKTEIASGSNPTWNRDLILVASEPFDDIVHFKLIDRVDAEHEQCIGVLKRKLSDMTPIKVPGGAASALFCDIEPAVKVEPNGDTRRFASRLKMKLAIEQSYHVFDECRQYCSDYRPFAEKLWGRPIGKLEIGILGATGLSLVKKWNDGKNTTDAYVVAKYGNKWARTRTVFNNVSPTWNEQYSWDVYEKCTVITLGIYDNRQTVVSKDKQAKDVPIGKVRIPLNRLEWNTLYTDSVPLLAVGKNGLKKSGEIKLAVRCVYDYNLDFETKLMANFRWMLPKSHYCNPLSLYQIEELRVQAVQLNCLNLAKTHPPLRNEVVMDMLKPKSTNFSMRITKANYERIAKVFHLLSKGFTYMANIRATTDHGRKWIALGVFTAINSSFCLYYILWSAIYILLVFIAWEVWKLVVPLSLRIIRGSKIPPPPLNLIDVKLSQLELPILDELAEEFDVFPSSETDVHVLRMRYDRLRKMAAKVMMLLGDIASQSERLYVLLTLHGVPARRLCILLIALGIVFFSYYCWELLNWVSKVIAWFLFAYWLDFRGKRVGFPYLMNFFRRLPTNEGLIL